MHYISPAHLRLIHSETIALGDREHVWYHFWNSVFCKLSVMRNQDKAEISVAAQQRYGEWSRPDVEVTRDSPVDTRRTRVDPLQELPEDHDDSHMNIDWEEGDSFGSNRTDPLPESKETVREKIPDFSFRYFTPGCTALITVGSVEIKPLGFPSEQSDTTWFAKAALHTVKPQALEQAEKIFKDSPGVHEFLSFIIYGSYFLVFRMVMEGIDAVDDTLKIGMTPWKREEKDDPEFVFRGAEKEQFNEFLFELFDDMCRIGSATWDAPE